MRAAVRTLTLNIYSIDDPEMQAFLAAEPAANYFTDFGAYLTERCQARGPTPCLPSRLWCCIRRFCS